MKDAKGHGSDAKGGSDVPLHMQGINQALAVTRPADPARVQSFVQGAQGIVNKYYATNFADSPHMVPPRLEIDNPDAPRYLRVVSVNRTSQGDVPMSRSAHAFIDRTTGDVLKPAGWKAPAKGVRGNIHDGRNGLGRMGPHGPAYNK